MQDAAVACWEDRDCIYIKDIDCDQQSFQLCINGTTQNSTKSCLYQPGMSHSRKEIKHYGTNTYLIVK